MGAFSRQANVVLPPLDVCDTSTPLDIAVRPFGTVTVMSYVALSRGLSLTGYHPGDPCGSPTTNAPSSVGTKPSIELSGSVMTIGTPAYDTTTVNDRPDRSPVGGVITSSWPSRVKDAARSL